MQRFDQLLGAERRRLRPQAGAQPAGHRLAPRLPPLDVAPVAALVGLGLLTAACGNNPTDRALTGGAIGAGTGAIVGSTVGAAIGGAIVGGAAGAGIGAATTPERRY